MSTKNLYIERIEHELTAAQEAQRVGNDGKARVCCRRAAGQALTWWCTKYPRPHWKPDALSQLIFLKDEQLFSEDVRNAAHRLTVKISGNFEYSISANPIEDARTIIGAVTAMMSDDAD